MRVSLCISWVLLYCWFSFLNGHSGRLYIQLIDRYSILEILAWDVCFVNLFRSILPVVPTECDVSTVCRQRDDKEWKFKEQHAKMWENIAGAIRYSPPWFQHCGGERPRRPRRSDASDRCYETQCIRTCTVGGWTTCTSSSRLRCERKPAENTTSSISPEIEHTANSFSHVLTLVIFIPVHE